MPSGRPKKSETPRPFYLSLTFPDGVREGVFESVEQGLTEFKPEKVTNRIIMEVRKGERSYNRPLFTPFARRMFNNPVMLATFARNVERSLP